MKLIKIFIFFLFLEVAFVGFNSYALAQSCPSQTQYSTNYATLVGSIVDSGGENNVQAWFEWGTTYSLGNSTPQQNLNISSVPYRFCYTLSNLNPCTTYYYQAVVRNSQGTNRGQIYSFTTRCQTPQPSLTISCYASPNPAHTGSVVTFYSNVSGGIGNYYYEWSGDCTGFSSTCQKTFSQPGNYSVTLKVTSGNEVKFTTCSVNILQQISQPSINQPPVAIIAFTPDRILPGTIVTFDASRSYDPDGYITSYAWYINNELTSNNISFSRALASGAYRIKLTVTDNQGATTSKEILIYVGRNVYRTKTVISHVPTKIRPDSSTRLVDVLLDSSYKVKKCSSQNIKFTLVNNTSINRQINIEINGEIKNWFEPTNKSFVILPNSTELITWKINVPCSCSIDEKIYEFVLKVSTPGEKFEKKGILEVTANSNPFQAFLNFIKSIPLWALLGWLLLLLILILVVISYFLFRYLRKKLKYV